MWHELASTQISLVTLDLGLGREDGAILARKLRAKNDVPLIMVTARSEDNDLVAGLEIGADDYITKPFKLTELLARVRAVLRRYDKTANSNGVLKFGCWTMDVASRELRSGTGDPVPLTGAEFNLLEVMANRPGRVLTRQSLMDLVGNDESEAMDRSVDTLVSRLRKKLEVAEAEPIIKTVRGVGYIFSARVNK